MVDTQFFLSDFKMKLVEPKGTYDIQNGEGWPEKFDIITIIFPVEFQFFML